MAVQLLQAPLYITAIQVSTKIWLSNILTSLYPRLARGYVLCQLTLKTPLHQHKVRDQLIALFVQSFVISIDFPLRSISFQNNFVHTSVTTSTRDPNSGLTIILLLYFKTSCIVNGMLFSNTWAKLCLSEFRVVLCFPEPFTKGNKCAKI